MILAAPTDEARAELTAWKGVIVPSPSGLSNILPKVCFNMKGKYLN